MGDVEGSEAVGDGQDPQQEQLVTEVHTELQTLLRTQSESVAS